MNIEPLLSIITVTYNNIDGLICTQKSINLIPDNLKKNIEWLVIDGNSTDSTKKFLESISSIPYVTFISEKDEGIYDAMNKGILLAKGKYLIFMNAGDYLFDGAIEKIMRECSKGDEAIIYGGSLEKTIKNELKYKKPRRKEFIYYGMITHHQAILFNRDFILKKNIEYNNNLQIASDYEFISKVFILDKNLKKINSPLCVFERGGLSQKKHFIGEKEQFEIRKNILKVAYPLNIAIHHIHNTMNFLREQFPSLYDIIRFKSTKKHV